MVKYMISVPHLTIGKHGQIVTAEQTRMSPKGLQQAVDKGTLVEVFEEVVTRAELYQIASDLGIRGRSAMTAKELQAAIAKAMP